MTVGKLAVIVAQGFAGMDKRFEKIDQRFDQVDKRFEQMEERLQGIDSKISGTHNRIDDLALNRATRDEMGILSSRVDRIEHKLGFKK